MWSRLIDMRASLLFSICAVVIAGAFFFQDTLSEVFMAEPTPRSDRLFREFDADIYALARRIERGDAINASDFAALEERIDQRYGNDITLLFHAFASANVDAIIALVQAGADLRIPDKPQGSARDFFYLLTLPGGDLLGPSELDRILQAYLDDGGDPNVRLQGNSRAPLIESLGLGGLRNDGVRILLAAGADPWAVKYRNGEPGGNLMTVINMNQNNFTFMDELIDGGYFDRRSQAELADFFSSFGGYAQRGDEISLEIQRVAKRILKRNPHYVETEPSWNTGRIFKKHWKDEAPGVIPWDEINSDAVR